MCSLYCILLQNQVALNFYGYYYQLFYVLLACNCAALWRVLSLFSYFIFLFCFQTSEAHSSFWNCFIFPSLFPFPSVCTYAHCFTNHRCTSFVLLAIVMSIVASDTSEKKSVAVLTRNCKCPINTGRLREDTINKIMHGLTMFP